MPFYVEFPTDPVVGVNWKKKDNGEPPPEEEDDCLGGTWEWHYDSIGESTLEIHDGLTIGSGYPADRFFTGIGAGEFQFWRVIGNVVEFGPPSPVLDPKNLYGHGLVARPGSILRMEGSQTYSEGAAPPGPPFPRIPMFVGSPGAPTLSFSRMTSNYMPEPPPGPFMSRGSSWEYEYILAYPAYVGDYPNFDPDAGGGPGVFYLSSTDSSYGHSPPYQEWYDFFYGGQGEPGDPLPPYTGDQFYNNLVGGRSTLHLKLTQICGPKVS